ncbi:MAG: hypothetical protein WCZ21_07145, partial [Bacteroidales bacterium]
IRNGKYPCKAINTCEFLNHRVCFMRFPLLTFSVFINKIFDNIKESFVYKQNYYTFAAKT